MSESGDREEKRRRRKPIDVGGMKKAISAFTQTCLLTIIILMSFDYEDSYLPKI
jgi:hypothetical protein